MSEEENKEIIERQKEVSELMEEDLVYKTLVENFCNSTYENSTDCLNALATYTNRLNDSARLNFIKGLHITNEDIAEMFKLQIIDNKTMAKIVIYQTKEEGDK